MKGKSTSNENVVEMTEYPFLEFKFKDEEKSLLDSSRTLPRQKDQKFFTIDELYERSKMFIHDDADEDFKDFELKQGKEQLLKMP